MAYAIEYLKTYLQTGGLDDDEQRQVLGMIGVFSRLLGNLDDAEANLLRAIELSSKLNKRDALIANRIRLATVYQWQGAFIQADELFTRVIAECEAVPEASRYLDFACQHYGKCLFDQGRYAEAEAWLERALELRCARGDGDLVESTRMALLMVRAHLLL